MAITASAAGASVLCTWPWQVTENKVTFTLDGSDQSLAVAGTAHGGPDGLAPDVVQFVREGGDSTDATAFMCNVTNFDTTNNEVDYTLYLADAGTNTKTVILTMTCVFFGQASGGIS